jgi:divalent metal cation (Fe/Co/Zn/Cd) transporter
VERTQLVRRAIRLSLASILLNAILGGIAVAAALLSGSLALLGFGFEAMIDSAASVALVWRFRIERSSPESAERVERIAETILGGVLVAVAGYLAVMAVRALALGLHPEPTTVGTVLLLVSVLMLPPLARAKYETARLLGSGALRADSILTGLTALLGLVALIGLVLSTSFGLHWVDAVGALVVAGVLAREGWASLTARNRIAAQ